MRETMWQVTITIPEHAELLERAFDTSNLAPTELLGRTLSSLISAGTEIAGEYTPIGDYLRYPGYASVFEVEAVGSEVTDIVPGDRVLCKRQHASRQRELRENVVLIPDGLSSEQATCARMMNVSMSTLTTTMARPPEPVCVVGLGPVGHFAAQIFQSCGYQVTGVDLIPARRDDTLANGIPSVSDHLPVKGDPLYGQVGLVVECSGHEQAVIDACQCVRKRGEVVMVGVPWKRKSDRYAFDLLSPVFHNYVVLRSGWEWELPILPEEFRVNSIMGNLTAGIRWLAEGRITTNGLIHTYSPHDAQQAYQDLLHRQAPTLLTVFDWSQL